MDALSGALPGRRALSVRAAQRASLFAMLAACDDAGSPSPSWKVLVYDAAARDVVAPLLRVADLRARGVTLHLAAAAPRQPVPDVPAVYLVDATADNIARVAADAAAGLYDSVWLHFLSRVPRPLLEELADRMAAASPGTGAAAGAGLGPGGRPRATPAPVARVFDMYSHFHALEDDLFSLATPRVFPTLHAPGAADADVQAAIETVVDRLMCVLVTLRVVPVVRAPRGGPAEMVANLLDARLREAIIPGSNLFDGPAPTPGTGPAVLAGGSFAPAPPRPLLVLLDRTVDLPVMLHHTWTYQALAHDSLSLDLNRVSVPVREATTGVESNRLFDLDKSDEFWSDNAGLPFPMVAEAVETALQDYKREVATINRSATAVGADGEVPLHQLKSDLSAQLANNGPESGTNLAAAISSLPQLTKKKQLIDLHTNIATALLECIKSRGLDGYYQVEEELLSRPQSFDVERILALLRDSRGTIDDKFRLFLIYYLCVDGLSNSEIGLCTAALTASGCTDLRAFSYLKSIKSFTSTMASVGSFGQSDGDATSGINSSYAAVLGTLSQVASNVGNLILSADKALPSARIVSSLMDQRGDAEVVDGYLTFDAKGPKGGPPTPISRRPFSEALVCIVGPGNYIEYQNCKDYICSTISKEGGKTRMTPNGKTVIYGATELCSGASFLEQLSSLGRESTDPGVSIVSASNGT